MKPASSQTAPQSPEPVQSVERPYWTVGKILALFLGLIILGGVAAFAYSQYHSPQDNGPLTIVQVTVSGSAEKVGTSATPIRVDFLNCGGKVNPGNSCCNRGNYSDTYGNCYYGVGCGPTNFSYCDTDRSAGVSGDQYSIVISNHSSWIVALTYSSLGTQTQCYAGIVTIDSLTGTYNYQVRC